MSKVLVLGGTTEAFALARRLVDGHDLDVETSFAGRTLAPRQPAGRMRVGGFGGAAGLAAHLRSEGIDVVVDATHPFAARMRWNVAEACEQVGRPRLRLERPPWTEVDGDRWIRVPDLDAAAREVAGHGRVFLTVGRTRLGAFAGCTGTWFLVRCITPPDDLPLVAAEVVLDRGPFTLDGELALMRGHAVDVVVTKNSGGTSAAAKLAAARSLGLAVVVVDRPPNPPGPLTGSVDEAEALVLAALDGDRSARG